jgi:7-cyano-7-deazaguanine synthase
MSIDVPKDAAGLERECHIPVTYVPARNLIFLSCAAAWAEVLGAFDIFIGVNVTDYSGYPDCRPEFIESFEKTCNLALAAAAEKKGKYKIHTPIIKLSKAEIIKKGVSLGVDYAITHSCYDPNKAGQACKKCDSCRLRLKGFTEAGLTDPVKYTTRD